MKHNDFIVSMLDMIVTSLKTHVQSLNFIEKPWIYFAVNLCFKIQSQEIKIGRFNIY